MKGVRKNIMPNSDAIMVYSEIFLFCCVYRLISIRDKGNVHKVDRENKGGEGDG